MTINQTIYERGKTAGIFPSLSSRRDEAYVGFIEDARNLLLHAQQKPIGEYSRSLLQDAGKSMETDPKSSAEAQELLMKDSVLKTYYRVKRSLQESFWECILNSFNMKKNELLQALDDAEKIGPGSVSYDPDYAVADYTKREIHLQPGGYVNEPLAGFIYDYGLKVFMGGSADNDAAHKGLASTAGAPKDGQVSRILDLGCSAGGTITALKNIYPDAEALGIDVSAAMVRYAHLRAAEQNVDIHFKQMHAEELDFEDNSFDIVTATLLFHELPVSMAKKVIAEALRVLRPGGSFTIFDFPSANKQDVYGMFFGEMDALDNVEPYIPEYVRSNVEEVMDDTGFEMFPYDPSKGLLIGRIGTKPEN